MGPVGRAEPPAPVISPGRTPEAIHNRQAPLWAAGFIALCATGVSTNWIDFGAFWRGYVLDITGPAWCYILFRGRFTRWSVSPWTRAFSPTRTMTVVLLACIAIEAAQFMELYAATYDAWDFVAYLSLLVPIYVTDLTLSPERLARKERQGDPGRSL